MHILSSVKLQYANVMDIYDKHVLENKIHFYYNLPNYIHQNNNLIEI